MPGPQSALRKFKPDWDMAWKRKNPALEEAGFQKRPCVVFSKTTPQSDAS